MTSTANMFQNVNEEQSSQKMTPALGTSNILEKKELGVSDSSAELSKDDTIQE